MNTENNILIAEFMGAKLPYKNKKGIWEYMVDGAGLVNSPNREDLLKFLNFNYHNDWNCIMEVVKKIADETEYELVSGYDYCYWNKYGENPFENAEEGFGGYYKIENIYKAVVEFIKWHNNKTK
jgi:hypothetical protein|tara:strand:+ start:4786 stop:5157 length:372 start_codon:yes stop_codon:yes gene_type:complete